MYIYIYIYLSLSLSIYIYIYIDLLARSEFKLQQFFLHLLCVLLYEGMFSNNLEVEVTNHRSAGGESSAKTKEPVNSVASNGG